MAKKIKKAKSGGYPLPVRILSLIMAVLVASGIIVYLVTFIMGLFA